MSERLAVSFWSIGLGNLPEGSFTHRRILPDEAKTRIESAREKNTLMCLSSDDLLAPYRKGELEDHRALCRVLAAEFGITLSINDFVSNDSDDADPLFFANPLELMTITDSHSLLVISCTCVMPELEAEGKPAFAIVPASVAFHLFQAASERSSPKPLPAGSETDIIGCMRDDAELLDEIVEEAMRRRQASAWLPNREDFAALLALSEATGQHFSPLLNEALRQFLQARSHQAKDGGG